MIESIGRFLRDERGLTTIEYAVAGGLISLAIVFAFIDLGQAVGDVVSNIETLIP